MTTAVPIPVPRPSARSLRRLIATETKLAYRVPVGLVLGVVVPVLLLVIFGLSPGFKKPVNPHTTITFMDDYVPVLMALTLALIALVSLPIPMVMNRERKYLRRLSATPVAPVWLLGAQVAVNLVMAVVAMGMIVGGGVLFFDIKAPGNVGGFILAVVLATASLFALGLFIAAVSPSPPVAGVLGTVVLYPLLYFAGLWVPRQNMAPALRHIGDFTPLGSAVQSLLSSLQGAFPATHALVVMARLGGGLLGRRGQALPLGVDRGQHIDRDPHRGGPRGRRPHPRVPAVRGDVRGPRRTGRVATEVPRRLGRSPALFRCEGLRRPSPSSGPVPAKARRLGTARRDPENEGASTRIKARASVVPTPFTAIRRPEPEIVGRLTTQLAPYLSTTRVRKGGS